MDITGHNRST